MRGKSVHLFCYILRHNESERNVALLLFVILVFATDGCTLGRRQLDGEMATLYAPYKNMTLKIHANIFVHYICFDYICDEIYMTIQPLSLQQATIVLTILIDAILLDLNIVQLSIYNK